jgi:hypothetical protein
MQGMLPLSFIGEYLTDCIRPGRRQGEADHEPHQDHGSRFYLDEGRKGTSIKKCNGARKNTWRG